MPCWMLLVEGGELGFGTNQALLPLVAFHVSLLLSLEDRFEECRQHIAMFIGKGNRSAEVISALGIAALRMKMLSDDVPDPKRALVKDASNAEWLFSAH